MDDDPETQEINTAIIFWRGALDRQYTPETQEFAKEQIARLEKRAELLAEEPGEEDEPWL